MLASQACSSCANWHASGYTSLRIAVNLSVRQLNGIELIQLVDDALKSTGLPADCLVLELTESMVMSDVTLALDTLGALNERGVHLAIAAMADRVLYLADGRLQRVEVNSRKLSPSELSW